MVSIADNLQAVKARIVAAARACGRAPETVALLAVSKTWPAEQLHEALRCGQLSFGENYVQELLQKSEALAAEAIDWHFIGPLQSNKTRPVAERAHWVHSIDRLKLAERLSAQRPAGMPPLNICVQVNVSGEASKSGCLPDETAGLCTSIRKLPNLRMRGLMCIPEPTDDPAKQRAAFARLRALFKQQNSAGAGMDTLSMGMSHDLESAVAEGATIVRIGTAIFGERNTK